MARRCGLSPVGLNGIARSRRAFVASAATVGLTGLPSRAIAAPGDRPDRPARSLLGLPAEMIPPELGQTAGAVYVSSTGHTLQGVMLDYWRAGGALAVFGAPVSEPFASSDGLYSQAFETCVLQYRPEFLYTTEPILRPMAIGRMAVKRAEAERPDGRRPGGGGDRRVAAWRPLAPGSESVAKAVEDGGQFFEETGYTLVGELLDWWVAHDGAYYLGPPVSHQAQERDRTVQYFEGGVLASDGTVVRPVPVVPNLAQAIGVDTTPVMAAGLPEFDEVAMWTAPNPAPLDDPRALGRKRIEISVSQQSLWAFQGTAMITSSLVSTGVSPNDTSRGVFRVRLKYPVQDMQGFTDGTGEVIAVGDATAAGGIPYEVRDVPDVMYFTMNAEALHGTYWHNNFGTPMSHGCVNLPLDVAAFLYGWAPLGTEVWVHD